MFKNWRTLPKYVWAFCTDFEIDKETGVPYRYSALVKMVRRDFTTNIFWSSSFEEVYYASDEKIAVPSSSHVAASLIAAIHGIQAFDFGSSRLTRKALQNAIEL